MSGTDWRPIGVVDQLARHVLKGTASEVLTSAKLGWHGISFDRRFGLLRAGDKSGLPWASPRQHQQLVKWKSSLVGGSVLQVAVQDHGDDIVFAVDVNDQGELDAFAKSATELLGEPVKLMNLWSGTFDSMSLSLITTGTMNAVAGAVGEHQLDWRRFRANLVVDTGDQRLWPERQWLGSELRLGEKGASIVRVVRHTTRCQVIDVNPMTGIVDLAAFEAVKAVNRNRAGVYATPQQVGVVETGATVYTR